MKKILLLLCTVAIMACSKDDDNIQYDNTIGYLTNLESVKFGIVGRWIWENDGVEYPASFYEFFKNGDVTASGLLGGSIRYEIYEKDGGYWITLHSIFEDKGVLPSNDRIEILNKTYLRFQSENLKRIPE
ncbi:MAG: hypothetical protein LBK94_01420 [Prevotellaceae bacterium]|jgi:hypothetical protein|nr:hypothetical protein [Prevotellaceae bacterium]